MQKIKVGIIGSGRFGTLLESKFKKVAAVEFTADKNTDYAKLLGRIDWAVIATPSHTHYVLAKLCLENGCNVFCEKPFVQKLSEAEELYKIADKKKKSIYVDDVFLHRTEYKELKSKISGSIPESITFTWKKTGEFKDTIANDFLYHDLYMLHSLFSEGKISDAKTEEFTEYEFKGSCKVQFERNKFIDVFFIYSKKYDGKVKTVNIVCRDKDIKTVDFSNPSNDALQEMVNHMFLKKEIERNRNLMLKTMNSFEIFNNLQKTSQI